MPAGPTFALAIAAQLSIRVILPKAGRARRSLRDCSSRRSSRSLLTRLGVSSDYVNLVLPATLLFGAGLGMVVSASIATATAGIAPADVGAASALVNVGQQVGGSIGTSLLNTLAALAALHGYDVGFTWAAAITTGLLRRPAATTTAQCPETCGSRA